MEYWTYENWRAHGHRAKVHFGHCGHCNHGQGTHGGGETPNGKWHGPFGSFDLAWNAVRGGVPVSTCGICCPS